MPDTIKTDAEARHRANTSLSHHTGDVRNCIVSSNGSVYINCDVEATKKQLTKDKEKFFVVKNEEEKTKTA
jgi:hypothetical protein